MEGRKNALVVGLHDVFRYALHAEDFDIEACTIRESVVDG